MIAREAVADFLFSGAVVFIIVCVLFFIATNNLPDQALAPAPASVTEQCTCVGRDDCQVARFDTDGTGMNLAYCALYAGGTSCCIEPTHMNALYSED